MTHTHTYTNTHTHKHTDSVTATQTLFKTIDSATVLEVLRSSKLRDELSLPISQSPAHTHTHTHSEQLVWGGREGGREGGRKMTHLGILILMWT